MDLRPFGQRGEILRAVRSRTPTDHLAVLLAALLTLGATACGSTGHAQQAVKPPATTAGNRGVEPSSVVTAAPSSIATTTTTSLPTTPPAPTTGPVEEPSLPVGESLDLTGFEDRPTLLQRVDDPSAPLVVVFHGSRGSIENVQKRSGLHLDGPAAGVAVLWLSGKPLPKRSWNTNNRCCDPASTNHVDDMAYVDAAIDAVRAEGLSPVRIITAGVSNGAGMAVSVACKRPKTFSAAVSVAGWMPVSCRNTAVSLVAIGGTKDDVVGRRKPKQMASTWRRFVVQCPNEPSEESDGPAHVTTWRGCTSGTFVRLVVLDDIEHLWPRFDFYDATGDIIRVAQGRV